MLPLSQQAMAELESPDTCVSAIKLLIGFTDYTALVSSVGTVRSSIRPIGHDSDMGILSVTMDNTEDTFSYLKAGTPFYGQAYQSLLISLSVGVEFRDGRKEVHQVFTGVIDYIEVHAHNHTAVIKASDALGLLRSSGPGALVDKTMSADRMSAYEDAPSAMILKILVDSALSGLGYVFCDSQSFESAILVERSAGSIVRGFRFMSGSWWDNVYELLRHGGAGLRVDATGRLEYFRLDPQLASGSTHLTKGANIITLAHRQNRADIRNSVGIRVSNGTDLVATGNSPIEDATSISIYGIKPIPGSMDYPLYQLDWPAEAAASRTMLSQSTPITTFDVEAHFEAIQIEVGDFVLLTDSDQGLTAKSLLCFERAIFPDARRVSLSLMDFSIVSGLWARADAGHYLDSTRVWW